MAEPSRAATPSARADLELARRCAHGDREAQLALFEQQRAQVHRTLFRIMGSNRHMEDLAQDAFIEVFASIASFRGESSLKTWVDSIAARTAFRHLSRRAPRTQHLEAVPDLRAPGSEPEREADARSALRSLYAVLDRLEPKYRIAYSLAVIDGRPLAEVARITRASLIAVKNRVWRARRMVRERARRDPLLAELLALAEESR
jgi:RNA polymerase sigma-70 factor (ECF subfamily)